MEKITKTAIWLLSRTPVLVVLCRLAGSFLPASAAESVVDPTLKLTVTRTNQNLVLSWFASNAVAYQVESSVNLAAWSNSSPVITGSGAWLFSTNSMGAPGGGFFRVQRLAAQLISAQFEPLTGILTVTGDEHDNTIVVGRNAAGALLVNGGVVQIGGGAPTVANTTLIRIFGREGNDQLSLDEANGTLPRAELYGEAGNDTLVGGSGADFLSGGPDADTLFGKGGTDSLSGGDGDDVLVGGDGDDQVFGEAGNDRLVWNPGDDTDLIEGGDGIDTVEVNGGNGAEQFTTTANGTRVRFDRINPAPFFLDIGTCEKLVLNANGGDDSFSATGNLAALIQITVDGGPGNDTLLGSNGADVLIGGDGDDFIDGQQGNDLILLGAGNDTFQWDPGDGSDTVEGQDGNDTVRFNGAAISENYVVSTNGGRVRFTRDVGNVVLDLNGIKTLNINALGGSDTATINSLAGTGLALVNVDLASTLGGAIGDAQADTIIVNGTSSDDIITATLPSGQLLVTGLGTDVLVQHADQALDTVRLQGLDGDDIIDASAVGVGGPVLVLDGGIGNDILLGGAGDDTLLGGDNDDVLLGNGGVDVLDGGLGDNLLMQDGANVTNGIVSVFGDDAANTIVISRDAAGNLLSNRTPIPGATVANTFLIRVFGRGGDDVITLDESMGALPPAALYGGAGSDTLTGGSGGDLLFGGINQDTLLGKGGSDLLFGGSDDDLLLGGDGDDQVFGEAGNDRLVWNPGDDTDLNEGGAGIDIVEVNGGNGAEQFTTTANGTRVRFDRINPAPFFLDIGACEKLVLNANGGDDSFSATGNLAALIQITVDGGPGKDTILGSNGADVLIGGDDDDFIDGQQGNDVIFLGAGNDTFQWDPGDGSDTVEGQDGNDTVVFNGSAISEIYDASANGARVRFTRNIGSVVMDFNGIETLNINALGGSDAVTVNSLAGTGLATVNVDLTSTLGGTSGDAQPDTITVNGTAAPDVISIFALGGVQVSGLAPLVSITHSEAAVDNLIVNGLGGVDTITTGPGVTTLIGVAVNQ